MNRGFLLLSRLGIVLAGGAVLLMMLHVTLDSLGRTFFHAPALGTIEVVSYYYMVMVIFLGLYVATWEDKHLAADVVYEKFPSGFRRLCRVFVSILSIGYLSVFAYALIRKALKATAINEEVDAIVAHLSIWPARWLAAAPLVAMTALIVWRFLSDLRHGMPEEEMPAQETPASEGTPK